MQDNVERVRCFRKDAEKGDAQAQYYLGNVYFSGLGVKQDRAEGVKWFRKAAEQGDAAGQNNLATAYFDGMGVPKDYLHAHMWFDLAAMQGDEEAAQERDRVAQEMTPEQITQAQKLARDWRR